ncbi:unnamed protein product [Dicrocoelium dendriticum]|nr:unnamed protein product [Dicrocoelium dendriticum]
MSGLTYALTIALIFCAKVRCTSVTNTSIIHSEENITKVQTERVCSDFLELLLDHMINRAVASLHDPFILGNVSGGIFQLLDGKLLGLKSIQRTCDLHLDHEAIWRKSNNTQINMGVTIPEWMKKRDEKTGDVLYLNFCLGTTGPLQLRGLMTVSAFLMTFGPSNVTITLSELTINITLSLLLNGTGKVKLDLAKLSVERLGRITFEPEPNHRSVTDPEGEVERSDWGEWADWLLNGPLYTPLLILLEASLADSVSAMLSRQNGW